MIEVGFSLESIEFAHLFSSACNRKALESLIAIWVKVQRQFIGFAR